MDDVDDDDDGEVCQVSFLVLLSRRTGVLSYSFFFENKGEGKETCFLFSTVSPSLCRSAADSNTQE